MPRTLYPLGKSPRQSEITKKTQTDRRQERQGDKKKEKTGKKEIEETNIKLRERKKKGNISREKQEKAEINSAGKEAWK
jgi:hypothetical protein